MTGYNKEKIQEWFEEVKDHPEAARLDGEDTRAVIYKGFKLEVLDNVAFIFDARFRDLYSSVSKKNLRLMENLGFERACDTIQYHRSLQRMERYKRKLSKMETNQLRLGKTNKKSSQRKINGLQKKKEQALQEYYTLVNLSQNLKRKLEV